MAPPQGAELEEEEGPPATYATPQKENTTHKHQPCCKQGEKFCGGAKHRQQSTARVLGDVWERDKHTARSPTKTLPASRTWRFWGKYLCIY